MGPNVKKLIAYKMSRDAVPSGGGVADALGFLTDPKKMTEGAKKATTWVYQAILAVQCAADPNPYRHLSEEAVADVLLKAIEKKQHEGSQTTQQASTE